MSSHPSDAADLDLGGQPANGPAWPCIEWGLPGRRVATAPVRSYRTFSPLPVRARARHRRCFLWHFPAGFPGSGSRPPCPVMSGLSSKGEPPRLLGLPAQPSAARCAGRWRRHRARDRCTGARAVAVRPARVVRPRAWIGAAHGRRARPAHRCGAHRRRDHRHPARARSPRGSATRARRSARSGPRPRAARARCFCC